MRRAAVVSLAAWLLATAAFAQPVTQTGAVQMGGQPVGVYPRTTFVQSCNGGAGGIVGQAGCTMPAAVATGAAVIGTDASGTVATAGVYQTLQAANTARRGCLVQNTDTVVETIRFGTTVYTLQAGQTINCTSGVMVNGDAVSITSATAGAKFSAEFQ